ncbi:hypothetical protein [cf. Phormidesmis sp. LEGE 11477]|uniref:hypothetical protein n=1 Tax=cf. Phormidesmis sp. LEGE 11477 TaxID=1828680 RepID=UPI0018827F65|nr:hypothetical protein [cf. Phormidesmis sp. LEGE 11477]MBE9064260.1 hypothetical protein [cf. Phormidesmis sp. LEGE 11477]
MKIANWFPRLKVRSSTTELRPQTLRTPPNPNLSYFIYAVPVAAVAATTTLFLTVKLAGRIDWAWVTFVSSSSAFAYVGIRCLEDTPGANESAARISRSLQQANVLQSELTAQLRVSRESQGELARKLADVNAALRAAAVEAKETRIEARATQAKVAALQTYLTALSEQPNAARTEPAVRHSPPLPSQPTLLDDDLLACDPLVSEEDTSYLEDAWSK